MNLIRAARTLKEAVADCPGRAPLGNAAFILNPLDYAWGPHRAYIERYGPSSASERTRRACCSRDASRSCACSSTGAIRPRDRPSALGASWDPRTLHRDRLQQRGRTVVPWFQASHRAPVEFAQASWSPGVETGWRCAGAEGAPAPCEGRRRRGVRPKLRGSRRSAFRRCRRRRSPGRAFR